MPNILIFRIGRGGHLIISLRIPQIAESQDYSIKFGIIMTSEENIVVNTYKSTT